MTYCLGIKTRKSLIGIADTRITSGNQTTFAKKISVHQHEQNSLFVMTSGLRSVRDKALTYFDEVLEETDKPFNKLYKAVNALAEQLRRVAAEDKKSLQESGLDFNLHAIVGGQLRDDPEHKLYLLYPEGNWVESSLATPFFIIGNTGYGKPILHRVVTPDSTTEFALKAGFISFDATRLSTNDVGFPIDVLVYNQNSFNMEVQRFERDEFAGISKTWNESIVDTIHAIDGQWINKVRGDGDKQQ